MLFREKGASVVKWHPIALNSVEPLRESTSSVGCLLYLKVSTVDECKSNTSSWFYQRNHYGIWFIGIGSFFLIVMQTIDGTVESLRMRCCGS